MILTLLIVSLSVVAVAYGAYLLLSAGRSGQRRPSSEAILLGAVTNFFDTLGIGSFAPSIAWMQFRRLVPDRLIPLTVLGGYILPASAQALIFLVRSIHLVKLDYRVVLGLALGAIPAVLVAALIVKEMPMTMLRWLVVVVVSYAGGTLLLSATRRIPVAALVEPAVLD